MVRLTSERVLLVGDVDRQMQAAVSHALPGAQIRSAATVFDAVAELTAEPFAAVLLAAEPIERRPEAAVRTLRELCGEGRLLMFGHPTLEPLSQKMLEFGLDDYLVTPVTASELVEVLGTAHAPTKPAAVEQPAPDAGGDELARRLPLAQYALDAILQFPQDAIGAMLRMVNDALPPQYAVTIAASDAPMEDGLVAAYRPEPAAAFRHVLHLAMPPGSSRPSGEAFLQHVATQLNKLQLLQDRHAGLQRLAVTDDLTGLANGRYFRHFLAKILEKAKEMWFPVTLFLFDIDNFKQYNDKYGHGVGDNILKQTAAVMRRCVRDHDLVARISGDEFAMVLWEKDGPRQPRDSKTSHGNRTPREAQAILDRFRRLLSSEDFPLLGAGGKGCLTISGGLAVYPYHAQDVASLIEAADKQLMFGAKRAGRNSIHLVGGGECLPLDESPAQE